MAWSNVKSYKATYKNMQSGQSPRALLAGEHTGLPVKKNAFYFFLFGYLLLILFRLHNHILNDGMALTYQ